MKTRPISHVVLFAISIAALAYVGSFLVANTYESDQTIYFPQSLPSASSTSAAAISILGEPGKSNDGGVMRGLSGAFVSPLVGSGVQTADAVLSSTHSMREVVKKLDLEKEFGLKGQKAILQLRKQVNLIVDKYGMLQIVVTSSDPELGVRINKALFTELEKRTTELTIDVSHQNRVYIEGQVKAARERLDRLKISTTQDLQGNTLAGSDQLPKAYFSARQAVEEAGVKQAAAEAKFKLLNENYKQIFAAGTTSPGNIVAATALSSGLTELIRESETRRIALGDAVALFSKGSAELKSAKVQDRVTQKLLNSVIAPGITQPTKLGIAELIKAQSELAASEKTISSSRTVLARYEKQVKGVAGSYVLAAVAKSQFEAAVNNLELLERELELAKIAESRDPSRFVSVDEPFVNTEPIGPRRALIAAFAFVIALLAGFLPRLLTVLRNEPTLAQAA